MGLTLVTAAATDVLTLTEVKTHLRISGSAEDDRLPDLIDAAELEAADLTGRQFVTATWDYTLDAFPAVIDLPKPPIVSITSITYIDSDGASRTLATTVYQLDKTNGRGRITTKHGQTWPATRSNYYNAVTVRFVAGYGAASAVPGWARSAIKLLLEDLFLEDAGKARERALALLYRHRVTPLRMVA